MNAARLLEYFDRIAEAPDAVSRLRKFILDLAVRGKLVEQDPNDEPASELLQKIQIEKEKYIREGKAKRDDVYSLVAEDEISFEIPMGWGAARLITITSCLDYLRKPINSNERGKRTAGKSEEELFPYYGATQQQGWIDDYIFDEDLVLLGEDGVPFFDPLRTKSYMVAGKVWVNNHAHVFRPYLVSGQFLVHYLNLFDYSGRVAGATRAKLNQSKALDIPVPLPPLAEQHRIVAKVDELMALCDRLEASQAKRESRRDRLATASLRRIGQPEDVGNGEEFRENVRFHLRHLPRLATRPGHVRELRQTILNLAVRGKLVPQDPNDEPASELLSNICAEKLRLIKLKLIRNEKNLPAVSSSEEQFVVPMAWIWTRIGTCAAFSDYGTSCQTLDIDDGVPVLKMGDIQDGRVVLGYHKKVPATLDDLPGLFLQKFDLLYNRTNSAELVGKTGIFLGEDGRFTFASYLIRIRFLLDFVSPVYVNYVMNSPYFRETQIVPELKQQCGQANVNGTKLRNMVIPLPPLAEQHRIVAKVDELMNLCDKLEVHLATSQTNQSRLLEATLCDTLGIACLPVSRPSRPAPSPTRVVAAHSEQPPKPLVARPVPAQIPTAAVQGSLIEQPTPQVRKPRAVNGDIPGAILAQMQPGLEYSRAQLAEALGLSVYEWNMAIRELKESGRVVQTGERRGARYFKIIRK